ncbi:MAG: adenylosuccinate synthase [Anaerolineales bacterium]|jgi:adenylosuccinate synthase
MPLNLIIGAQWGDEGKGRITDLLAEDADIVARFSGGDNAGHSVTVGDQLFKLHLIPSGIIQPGTVCCLGSGMVINPKKLIEEMDQLEALGVDVSPARVRISGAAHIITPAHILLDSAKEMQRGDDQIGTTKRGIGPAYTDKTARSGIRVEAMLDPESLRQKMKAHLTGASILLENVFAYEKPAIEESVQAFLGFAERLRPYIAEVGSLIAEALQAGQKVLAEGAQGTLLDLDHGTYPFVTSSHPTTAGALLGLGVGPGHLERIVGVTKAFQTRVGEGPFPTELSGKLANQLRGTGENPWDEFGTTTGRPRRVGWLDGVLLRYAQRVNGFTELAITKLDILSGLNDIQFCTGYSTKNGLFEQLPSSPSDLSPYEPVYERLDGWDEDITDIKSWSELPSPAKKYIEFIEAFTGLPVRLISVGPERDQVIRRD